MDNFKEYKLLNSDDFSSVFNFKKRLNSSHFFFHLAPNHLGHYRLGFVIGKKMEKNAVKRNYMRRSIREVLKSLLSKNFSFDIVVRVQKSFYRSEFSKIKSELELLIGRIE